MQATWVFDDFGRGVHQRDLVMLLASVKLWSIHCPDTSRVLYCSDALGNAVVSSGESKLFDNLILLPNRAKYPINSQVFWAYPKLEVLAQLQNPTYLIDHDFMVFEDIRKSIPENRICYCYTEDSRQYYPGNQDSYIKNLNYRTRWPEKSANVSFLQLPFPEFTQFYAGTSLQIMEELTELKAPDARYLIFAEQMVFKHLLDTVPTYSCLIKNEYECRSESWTENLDENGIWTLEEAWGKKFIHYGPVKKRWTKATYDRELSVLCDLAGFSQDLIRKTDYLRK